MSDFGIKVSRDGYDVTTAGDTDLSFSSEFNTPLLARVLKVTGVAGGAVADEAHGLSYPPMFNYFRESSSQWFMGSANYFAPNTPVWADSTNIYFLGSEGEEIYVYIFLDDLSG